MEAIVKKWEIYSLIWISDKKWELKLAKINRDEVITEFIITNKQRYYINQWVKFTYNNWIILWDTTEIDELEKIRISNEYKEKRKAEYPLITDQLDMLYHDGMDWTNKWLDVITEIKLKYPKPD